MDVNFGTTEAAEILFRLIGASAVKAVRLLVDALHFEALRRRRPGPPHQDPRLYRTRLALAVRPHAPDPPRGIGFASFVPELTIIGRGDYDWSF